MANEEKLRELLDYCCDIAVANNCSFEVQPHERDDHFRISFPVYETKKTWGGLGKEKKVARKHLGAYTANMDGEICGMNHYFHSLAGVPWSQDCTCSEDFETITEGIWKGWSVEKS